MTPEQERWAEALALERIYGTDAPLFVATRVGALLEAGDMAGVERFRQIATCMNQMLEGRGKA